MGHTYKLNNGINRGTAYWSFQINSSQRPTMICIGVVDKTFDCKQCIGSNLHSIGLLGDGSLWRNGKMISSQYTVKQFEAGTKIGIFLDMNRRELTFTINDKNAVTAIAHNIPTNKNSKLYEKMVLPPSSITIFPQSTPTLSVDDDKSKKTKP